LKKCIYLKFCSTDSKNSLHRFKNIFNGVIKYVHGLKTMMTGFEKIHHIWKKNSQDSNNVHGFKYFTMRSGRAKDDEKDLTRGNLKVNIVPSSTQHLNLATRLSQSIILANSYRWHLYFMPLIPFHLHNRFLDRLPRQCAGHPSSILLNVNGMLGCLSGGLDCVENMSL
jgi:hypothetical protein